MRIRLCAAERTTNVLYASHSGRAVDFAHRQTVWKRLLTIYVYFSGSAISLYVTFDVNKVYRRSDIDRCRVVRVYWSVLMLLVEWRQNFRSMKRIFIMRRNEKKKKRRCDKSKNVHFKYIFEATKGKKCMLSCQACRRVRWIVVLFFDQFALLSVIHIRALVRWSHNKWKIKKR